MADRPRRPLRTAEVDPDDLLDLFTGTPDAWGLDVDWKEWRRVVRGLRRELRERGCRATLPRCGDGDVVEVWLEEVNALIAEPGAFADGRTFEVIDLGGGGDTYTYLLCPSGFEPPSAETGSDD